ncbi:MAG: hypothetical protein M3Y54_18975 [Bacteroidota bacterium]|nr:hypothetical protein [Bacteroidota bacterium]
MKHAVLSMLTVLLLGLAILPAAVAQKATKAAPAKAGVATQPGDTFLGVWEWSDNGEIFHISIWRSPNWPVPYSPTHRTANVILGSFRYTRNGVVIAESTPTTVSFPATAIYPAASFTIDALQESTVARQEMEMVFYDHPDRKQGRVVLTFLPNSNDQISWQLHKVEEPHFYNTIPPNFRVPTAVTLTRQ